MWKMSRLDRAIREVLGEDVYGNLRKFSSVGGRVRLHEMACQQAFRIDLQTENATVLRDMWNELSRTGIYPKASWDVDE